MKVKLSFSYYVRQRAFGIWHWPRSCNKISIPIWHRNRVALPRFINLHFSFIVLFMFCFVLFCFVLFCFVLFCLFVCLFVCFLISCNYNWICCPVISHDICLFVFIFFTIDVLLLYTRHLLCLHTKHSVRCQGIKSDALVAPFIF